MQNNFLKSKTKSYQNGEEAHFLLIVSHLQNYRRKEYSKMVGNTWCSEIKLNNLDEKKYNRKLALCLFGMSKKIHFNHNLKKTCKIDYSKSILNYKEYIYKYFENLGFNIGLEILYKLL